MNYLRILTVFGPYIAIAVLVGLLAMTNSRLTKAREEVGVWKQKHATQVTYAAGLNAQLREANDRIKATAKAGSISYGHCQDLVANDAAKNFDLGVTFGKATCATPSSTAPSR